MAVLWSLDSDYTHFWEEPPPCSPWCEPLTDSGYEASSQVAVAWIQQFQEDSWTAILKKGFPDVTQQWDVRAQKIHHPCSGARVWKYVPVLSLVLSLSNKACPGLPIQSKYMLLLLCYYVLVKGKFLFLLCMRTHWKTLKDQWPTVTGWIQRFDYFNFLFLHL